MSQFQNNTSKMDTDHTIPVALWEKGALEWLYFSSTTDLLLLLEKEVGKVSAAMLTKMSPGITLGNDACKQADPPWLWSPGEMSREAQNKGISDQEIH